MGLPRQTTRSEIIRKLRALGWTGPIQGGTHAFMRRDTLKVRIPNPHGSSIHVSLLKQILEQAGVSDEE